MLRYFDSFPIDDEVVATVTDMDLVLLYSWEIESSSHRATIMGFTESGTRRTENKLRISAETATKDKRTWISAFLFASVLLCMFPPV